MSRTHAAHAESEIAHAPQGEDTYDLPTDGEGEAASEAAAPAPKKGRGKKAAAPTLPLTPLSPAWPIATPENTKSVLLKELKLIPAFQQRAALPDGLYDEDTVKRYTDLEKDHPDGDPLTAIRAVHVQGDGPDAGLYVYDGFQRVAARKASGKKEILVTVTLGTLTDALDYSLRANHDHGLQRSSKDCRKVLDTLTANTELMARCHDIADSRGAGGLNLALALTAGVSKGMVSKYLDEKGLCIRNGKICNKPVPKADPKSDADPDPVAPTSQSPANPESRVLVPGIPPGDIDIVQVYRDNVGTDMKVLAAALRLTVKKLVVACAAMTTHAVHGAAVRRLMGQCGLTLSPEYVTGIGTPMENFNPPMEMLEHWTIVRQLSALADSVSAHIVGDDRRAEYLSLQAGRDALYGVGVTPEGMEPLMPSGVTM